MDKRPFHVLVAGELNADIILDELKSFPELGKEVLADQMTITLGSSSAIFAANISVLGNKVSFCGRLGRDMLGEKILKDLYNKGVDSRNIVQSTTAQTGISIALNFQQDRAMITFPGAMNEFQASHVTDEILQSAAHLHISSPFLQPGLMPGLAHLFKRAQQNGLTTSLDPQWDPYEKWDCDWKNLLPFVDIFLPNISELKQITGQSSLTEAIDAVRQFVRVLVVKNGTQGAYVIYEDEWFTQKAFINNHFVDAIGAGDSFNAGFIHGFIRGKKLTECAETGALTAAISTTCAGGTNAFSDLEAIQKTAFEIFNRTIR